MDTSDSNNKHTSIKKHFNRFTKPHEFLLELSIITTLLVCLNFWSSLPDWGINPILGKIVAALGILIIIGMVAFRFKWPLLIAMVGLMAYMGVSHLQINETTITTENSSNPKNQTGENSLGINIHFLNIDTIK